VAIVGAPRSGATGPCVQREKRSGARQWRSVFADEPFVGQTNKITRCLADQLRSPLRAAPVFGAPMFSRARPPGSAAASGGLIGKNNVVLDANVLHGIVRLKRPARVKLLLQGLTGRSSTAPVGTLEEPRRQNRTSCGRYSVPERNRLQAD